MTAIQDALIDTLRRYSVDIMTHKENTKEYKTAKQNFFVVYQLTQEWKMLVPQDLTDKYNEWYMGGLS